MRDLWHTYIKEVAKLDWGTPESTAHAKKMTPGQSMKVEAPEDNEPPSPDEKSMAMRQANFIYDFAEDLVEYIEEGNDFPEWMQNKLTAIHEKAKDLYAAMEGGEKEDEDEMDDNDVKALQKARGVAEESFNEVTQGVEHSEWAGNVKDHYHPAQVRIIKKRTKDGRHVGSHATVNGKKVGQYNMNTGVGTFTATKKEGVAEATWINGVKQDDNEDADNAKYQ